jgi:hypothetical protein
VADGNRGRFQKGNPGNPNAKGRSKRSAEQSYLDATVGAVSVAARFRGEGGASKAAPRRTAGEGAPR